MAGRVPATHALAVVQPPRWSRRPGVGGRDTPGHDGESLSGHDGELAMTESWPWRRVGHDGELAMTESWPWRFHRPCPSVNGWGALYHGAPCEDGCVRHARGDDCHGTLVGMAVPACSCRWLSCSTSWLPDITKIRPCNRTTSISDPYRRDRTGPVITSSTAPSAAWPPPR